MNYSRRTRKKNNIERFIFVILIMICLLALVISGLDAEAAQAEMEALVYRSNRQAAIIQDRNAQIEMLEIILDHEEEEPKEISLGEFKITHYCPCEICCGKTDGITASGTVAQEGKTIAVDPEVIPLGSTVFINGAEYIAEDIGGAIKGNRIDIFMNSHSAALEAGVVQAKVYMLEKN